jgi:hypothetical protein
MHPIPRPRLRRLFVKRSNSRIARVVAPVIKHSKETIKHHLVMTNSYSNSRRSMMYAVGALGLNSPRNSEKLTRVEIATTLNARVKDDSINAWYRRSKN